MLKIINWLKSFFISKIAVTKETSKNQKNKTMNAKFFYGPHINHQNGKSTWAKLFVLTQDGTLYCEYLDYMKPSKIIESVNYLDFKPSDYSYAGYQHLEEISYEKAVETKLTSQPNWISDYLKNKGLL